MSIPSPLIDRKEVSRLTTKSRSTIYRDVRDGTFPAPVQVGARGVAWRLADVLTWIESREVGTRSSDAQAA